MTHDSCVSLRALATHFLFGLDLGLGIQLFCIRTSEAWDRVDCIGCGLLGLDLEWLCDCRGWEWSERFAPSENDNDFIVPPHAPLLLFLLFLSY